MSKPNFTVTLLVDQTPKEVFNAVNNVREWWSEEIEGGTSKLNDEFIHHYENVHYCRMKLVQVVPNKKVVWLVKYNYFNFTKDKNEWTGNKISFEISKKGSKTQLRFTQHGLVPQYECFDICSHEWNNYINHSLRSLISTGKGKPNKISNRGTASGKNLERKNRDYHASITVNTTAKEAFKSINSVTKWWTENLEGSSRKLNDEFTVRFGNVHVSTQRLVEVIPDKKVVWLVTDSKLNFVKDKQEWSGTRISFEISKKGKKTQIFFTHLGLVPKIECFNACSDAWGQYIKQSLANLINTGKGNPTPKENKKKALRKK